MRLAAVSLASMALMALGGCSAGGFLTGRSDQSAPPAPAVTTGCLAGVVIDGVSMQRIDVSGTDKAPNMFVLFDNQKLSATSVLGAGQAATQPNLVGEYTLCNVPVEVTLPFFVAFPGYQPLQTEVLVPATAAAASPGAAADLPTQIPTLPANVEVFQLATAPSDFNVDVAFEGAPLAGATVVLMPTGKHVLEQGVDFLPPDPTGLKSLQATTDASGQATFKATDLALGGVYSYKVLPVDASAQKVATGTVSIGYVTQPGEPYSLHVELAPTDLDLVIVSSTLSAQDYSPDGSVTYYFNRAIEIVPGTVDGVTATLNKAVKAALVADAPGNNASEQVNIAVSGQSLTLKPNLATPPDQSVEPGASITYNNVMVRPAGLGKELHVLTLSPQVFFFGGVAAPAVATTVTKSGDQQSGSPGQPLAQALGALVTDQYGAPVVGVSVSFAVAAGGGSLTVQQTSTDTSGLAQTFWTLGPSGPQSVTATAGTLNALTFTATFNAPSSLAIVSGNNQSALIGAALTNPLVVRVLDKNSVALPGATVTFAVADQTNGGTLTPAGGSAGKTVTATTDASGQASATWQLGTVGNTYLVNVTAGSAPQVNFSATALAPTTLVKVSGDAQSGPHNSALTNPIVVEIDDQNGHALPGVTLKIAASASGELSIDSGATYMTTVTAPSNASGQVSALWKPVSAGNGQTATVTVPTATGVTAMVFTADAS